MMTPVWLHERSPAPATDEHWTATVEIGGAKVRLRVGTINPATERWVAQAYVTGRRFGVPTWAIVRRDELPSGEVAKAWLERVAPLVFGEAP